MTEQELTDKAYQLLKNTSFQNMTIMEYAAVHIHAAFAHVESDNETKSEMARFSILHAQVLCYELARKKL